MNDDGYHVPVLLNETIDLLINKEIVDHVVVDGTLGGGGYSEAICQRFESFGVKNYLLICIDKDENAIRYSSERLKNFSGNIIFEKGNFADLKMILSKHKIQNVTGITLDLGLSSYQLEKENGFSFMRNTTLDMRADKDNNLTAAEILNNYSENELTEIFENYGEIGNAERLSNAIVSYRKSNQFSTTENLTEVIDSEYSIDKKNRIKFLAKIFQALRIEVNGELNDLNKILIDSSELLRKSGRIAIVTYHSLEDRIVKNYFKEKSFKEKKSKYGNSSTESNSPEFSLVNKKVITPGYKEISENPRSRSAKLRVAEKL